MATRQAPVNSPHQAPIRTWIKRTLKQFPPRSKSLIVTIFGDSIAPCSREIWLSEMIALLAPFHVSERLVRTSAFRLTEEGWLQSQREGRRSRYSLTPSGLHRIENAYHRIYDPAPVHWKGNWTLVILNKSVPPAAGRVELRRELGWEGFGMLASGIFLHPAADLAALEDSLHRLRLSQSVLILEARDLAAISSRSASQLAAECWDLEQVADHYRRFLEQFQPALAALHEPVDAQTSFLVQTLLIHSFRRVVLHDPRLPSVLLPQAWPGHTAYKLCREIYRLTSRPTQTYLADRLQMATDAASKADQIFRSRFGGL